MRLSILKQMFITAMLEEIRQYLNCVDEIKSMEIWAQWLLDNAVDLTIDDRELLASAVNNWPDSAMILLTFLSDLFDKLVEWTQDATVDFSQDDWRKTLEAALYDTLRSKSMLPRMVKQLDFWSSTLPMIQSIALAVEPTTAETA